jgi:DNA-binding transcriptional LysR family regulator
MSRRLLSLPPLELLRGFVAVGRCMSVTAAARELAITQPALSRRSGRWRLRGLRVFGAVCGRSPRGRPAVPSADAWLEQLERTHRRARP